MAVKLGPFVSLFLRNWDLGLVRTPPVLSARPPVTSIAFAPFSLDDLVRLPAEVEVSDDAPEDGVEGGEVSFEVSELDSPSDLRSPLDSALPDLAWPAASFGDH